MTVTHSAAMPRLQDEGDRVSAPGAYLCKRVVCALARGPNQNAAIVVHGLVGRGKSSALAKIDECVVGEWWQSCAPVSALPSRVVHME
jgi:hypothetical protein